MVFRDNPVLFHLCRRKRQEDQNNSNTSIARKYAGHLWSLRWSGDTSGTSKRSAQTEGSVVTGGFSSEEIRGACHAWNVINGGLQSVAY